MAFRGRQLHDFRQDVYRRIQIAAAVHVIKNTPPGKSPEAHAIEIQQKLKHRWLNSDHSSNVCVDQHILKHQQDALKLRLHSVVPQQHSQQLFQDSCFNLLDAPMTNKIPVENKAHIYYECLNRDKHEILANANFIQAVIHLKALAETRSTVPIQQYVSSISQMGNTETFLSLESADKRVPTDQVSSHDSGFYNVQEYHSSVTPFQGSSSSNVASSMLLYIISSCNADQLLEKSVQAILNQFKKISYGSENTWTDFNFQDVMDHWTGSIYQQSLGVLSSIIGEKTVLSDIIASSSKMCFTTLKEMIGVILKTDSPNEISYQTKENQVMLVLELSEEANLWFPTLEFIFSSLVELTAKIKTGHDESMTSGSFERTKATIYSLHKDTQLMDQCFYLCKLLKAFLTSKHAQSKEIKDVSEEKPTASLKVQRSVAGLWRKHYEVHSQRTVANSSATGRIGPSKSDLRCWKNILENPFNDVLFKLPLVAVIIYECVDLLSCLH